jgi:hypothetical protein
MQSVPEWQHAQLAANKEELSAMIALGLLLD